MRGSSIFDGERYWPIHNSTIVTEHVAVVEVEFANPQDVVLAWLLPRCRPHGQRALYDRAAVACLGKAPRQDDRPRAGRGASSEAAK